MKKNPFEKDPRVAQAKKLLQDALKDSQVKLKTPCGPHTKWKESYEQLIKDFSAMRGSPLWYPYVGTGFGNKALVELLDGSVKYDFISGIGVHMFGHSHPDIVSSAIDGALSDIVQQGNLQQNRDTFELTNLLLKSSNMDHCFLTTSGAMANENALKIAFQKKSPSYRILAFESGFAGRTYSMSQISDKPHFRQGLPLNLFVDYVPFYDEMDPEGSTKRAIHILHKHLIRFPKQHACMIFELVQGEAGFYPGSSKFFISLMKILKENQIISIIDEVQTFGRTNELFAFQHFKLDEFVDIVTLGKLAQVCATLFKKELCPKPGLLSQTFTSTSVAIQVGTTIIKKLLSEGFYGKSGKIAKLNTYFTGKLKSLSERYPNLIKGPYGIGSMIAFTPLDGKVEQAKKVALDLFEAGLIAFIAGSNPTRIRFLLPVGAIDEKDLDAAITIIETTLKAQV